PKTPHRQAGHMTAPDHLHDNQKTLVSRAPSTHDPLRTSAAVVMHSRFVTFQSAEIAIPVPPIADVLRLVVELWPTPAPMHAEV
ncbi:MAG: hypothetical protein ACYS8I_14220, partial [Planctomycetota bacterium]